MRDGSAGEDDSGLSSYTAMHVSARRRYLIISRSGARDMARFLLIYFTKSGDSSFVSRAPMIDYYCWARSLSRQARAGLAVR